MEITFRGWSREVYPHIHKVMPVSFEGGVYVNGKPENPINWSSSMSALGKINKVQLNGDFLVEFNFTPAELKNWLKEYVMSEPYAALKLISEMHAELYLNGKIWTR